MNRQEILELQSTCGFPSISLLMPTLRKHPESRQNKTNLKNLAAGVKQQLNGSIDPEHKAAILSRLDAAIEEIDFEHPQDGLAVFVNSSIAKSYPLPFTVKERVTINKAFETRELVMACGSAKSYYVLVLDEKLIRIYHGRLERISEVSHPKLPVESLLTQVKDDFDPQSNNIESKGTENQGKLKNCFREADHILKELVYNEKIPFVVTGSEKEIALYKEVTAMPELILGTVKGSYEKPSVGELAAHVWPVVKEGFLKEREQALLEADKATSEKRFAWGAEEVWQMAQEGRGWKLLVESGYSYPAKISEDRLNIELSSPEDSGSDEDVVDLTIDTVIAKGGEVIFFDDGMLESYNHIGLIMRY